MPIPRIPIATACAVLLSILLNLLLSNSASAEVRSVFIQSLLDFNAILITEVDIVFVYDQEVVNDFPATKTAWYSNKLTILQEAGDKIDLVNVFVPQGFDSDRASLPERRGDALKVFIFGQHDSSTRPPIDVTEFDNVLVEIDQFGLLVSQRS